MTAVPAPVGAPAPTVRQFRHRAEVPMLVVGGIVTVIGVGVILALLALRLDPGPELTAAALTVLMMPILLLIVIRWRFWSTMSDAVPVTPRQFPELHELYATLGADMGFTGTGLNALPRLYVVNGNGDLNAAAAKCRVRRAYVQIYSDLVDIAYEHGDFAGVKFVLAHELGHVKCRHVDLWRILLSPITSIVLLHKSVIRAQEYTADRVACYYAPEGAESMAAFYAGKRMYRHVDFDEYLDSIREHRSAFWIRIANFASDHAVGFRRMEAIGRTRTEGWDVHGRML